MMSRHHPHPKRRLPKKIPSPHLFSSHCKRPRSRWVHRACPMEVSVVHLPIEIAVNPKNLPQIIKPHPHSPNLRSIPSLKLRLNRQKSRLQKWLSNKPSTRRRSWIRRTWTRQRTQEMINSPRHKSLASCKLTRTRSIYWEPVRPNGNRNTPSKTNASKVSKKKWITCKKHWNRKKLKHRKQSTS